MKKISTVFFLLYTLAANCQNQFLIDSLTGILKSAKEDTFKVKLLNKISFEYRLTNEFD